LNLYQLYFNLGVQHILDVVAFDHILFLLVLCAPYSFKNYKRVIGLASLFTLGHTLTLIFSTVGWLNFSMVWIEFLIPCTILITAMVNLFTLLKAKNINQVLIYASTLFFGLIHGMGFSNYLQSLLVSESNLLKPLLFFNLGIEIGQLIVISSLLDINLLICRVKTKEQRVWNMILSLIGGITAMVFMVLRFPK
jgi:hypothetical protein